ncbi:MAG: DUF6624 domain-containing protein [Pyrinomonadaceae bacterium]
MNDELRQNLLAMSSEDVRVREKLAETGELFNGYCPKMEKVHLKNAAELEKMITENGWLGKSLVGKDGAEAAWLIVQHAISLPDFQRKCLKLIEKAVAENEAEPFQAAYLHDRICFFENRPQKYGTQSDWNETGKMEVWELEDKEKVNEYRAEVGLKPLKSFVWENTETRENKPDDFEKRTTEYENWLRKVGWR